MQMNARIKTQPTRNEVLVVTEAR